MNRELACARLALVIAAHFTADKYGPLSSTTPSDDEAIALYRDKVSPGLKIRIEQFVDAIAG